MPEYFKQEHIETLREYGGKQGERTQSADFQKLIIKTCEGRIHYANNNASK